MSDTRTRTLIEAPAELYDAQRGVYYPKPLLRGWSHLLVFEASLVIGTLLLVKARGGEQITAMAIYAGSVSGLFGVSALYHLRAWGAGASRLMQRLDHTMIFVLIAGSATPGLLLAAPRPYGLAGAVTLWALTLLAIAQHLSRMQAPESVVGAIFVGLGLLAGLALPSVWMHCGVAPGLLMLIGGVLYLAGAAAYHRRIDPIPQIFGYHEVFHAFVCAAAICQYVAIGVFLT